MDYIAIIHKEAKSNYGVSFPDFPGCITAGETLDLAKDRAAEALAFHIEGMIKDGEPLAEPSGLDKIMADPGFADGVAFLVTAPAKREKAVRVQLSLQPSVLAQIDASAAAAHTSRSAFIADAALKVIEKQKKDRSR